MKESPDNLVSKAIFRVTDALCEGPIEGFVSGNDDYGPLKSTFLNETVIMNANNSFNFNLSGDSFNYSFTLGESGQAVMPNYGHVENLIPLPANTEVKKLTQDGLNDSDYKDVVVSINNRTYPDASAVRITVEIPQLLKQVDPNTGNPEGSLEGYSISFKVEVALNGGDYEIIGEPITIFGKTTSGYSKSIEIPLPSDGSNLLSWKIRVRRTSYNISSLKIANTLLVKSISVISANEYSNPNTVTVGLTLDSERIGGGIPTRAYEIYGLKVKIPSNYDPDTRAYNGIWLGDFKSSIAQGSNQITNPNFNSGTTNWAGFRSTLSTSSVSPPGSYTNYGIATVDIAADGDKSYFSFYQGPGLTGGVSYVMRGYYKVSSDALNFKVGINNSSASEYATIGNATTWTYFETTVVSSTYPYGNWIEFIAQRAGECLTGDTVYLTAVEVFTPARDGKEYTNNPAWVFYDLCTNSRYGLGNYIKEEWVDKWTLYQIAQYCDEMVDNGKGGLEPRFTCNTVLYQQDDAYRVLLNLVSIFRGMLYFANGRLFPVQDALKVPVYQFSNANVINGVFNYGSSSKRTRHTVALVKWTDPDNFYRENTEVVEDTDGITKFGYQQLEMTAFACTSQAQAYRAGKWALVSEALETETITFKTAIEGTYLRPGDIFQVSDNERYNLNYGGRILEKRSETNVVLDRDVAIEAGKTYNLTVINSRYYLEATGDITGSDQINAIRNSQITTALVTTSSYTGNTLTVNSSLGTTFGVGSIWTLSDISSAANSTTRPKQYRCLATTEYNPYEIEVLGLEYQTGKFALIESGFSVVNNQVYEDTPTAPPVPGGFSDGTYQRLGVDYTVDQQQDYIRDYFQLDWFPVESSLLKFYRVRMTPPGGSQEIVTDTLSDTYSYALSGCRPVGYYLFSVTSVGRGLSESAALTGGFNLTRTDGVSSLTFNTTTPITGLYALPYDREYLPSGFESRTPTINILRNTGDYNGNDPRFYYITGYKFEIFSTGASSTRLLDLGSIASESMPITSANITSIGNIRTFDVRVTPYACFGNGETGLNGFAAYQQRFGNIPPRPPVYHTFSSTVGGVNYSFGENPLDTDISGVYLWASTSPAFNPFFGNQTGSSANTVGVLPLSKTGSYYMWYSLVDTYGTGGTTIYGPDTVNYTEVSGSIPDESITLQKFALGIEPIQVVGSLGSISSPTQGMMAFLTTDLKLYRYMGSAWSSAVSGEDIGANSIVTNKLVVGTIQGGYIAADAISGNHIRANTITADKMSVGSLNAISATLGSITGGELTITGTNEVLTKSVFKAGMMSQGLFGISGIGSHTYAIMRSVNPSTLGQINILGGGDFSTESAIFAGNGSLPYPSNSFYLSTTSDSFFHRNVCLNGTSVSGNFNAGGTYAGFTATKPYFSVTGGAVTVRGVNFRIYDAGDNQQARIDNTNGRYFISGIAVLNGQYPAVPTTLSDVITILQHHGLCQ